MALPTDRLAWRARTTTARRLLDDHTLVRQRIRTLVERVDARLRLEAVEAAAAHADERAKVERERLASLHDENDLDVDERVVLVRR